MNERAPAVRKFNYWLAMPLPAPDERCAVTRLPNCTAPQVAEWWNERVALAGAARDIQTRLWRAHAHLRRTDAQAACRRLALVSQRIARVTQLWEDLYARVSAAGASAAAARGFWLPRWHTTLGDDVREFALANGDDDDEGAPRARALPEPSFAEHYGPSLVLESAALLAMRCACAQQLASLHAALNKQSDPAESLRYLDHAASACAQARSSVLLRHAAAHNGCEPLLLAPHYFDNFLDAAVSAQAHYYRARLAQTRAQARPSLLTVYFLEKSARALRAAHRSVPLHAPLDALARYRHAFGALALAHVLYAAHTHAPLADDSDAERPVAYASDTDADALLEAPQTLLVEALACARAAVASSFDAPQRDGAAALFFDKALRRLTEMYAAFVPQLQTTMASDEALRAARNSVILRFAVRDAAAADNQLCIVCEHRAARGTTVSLDTLRTYTLHVPPRYAT